MCTRRALVALALVGVCVAGGPARAQQKTEDDEAAVLVEAARKALHDHDYDQAGKLLDRAITVNPRRIDAYTLRASVYAVRKEYGKGVLVMRRARELAPDSPDVLTALGTQLLLDGKPDEAVPILEDVVTRWPTRWDAQVLLGHQYVRTGQPKKAIVAFDAYFAHRPAELAGEDAKHRVDLADAHLRVGEPKEALALFEAVLAKERTNVAARLGAAWAQAALDCRLALPRLEALADLAEKHPEVWYVEGRCAMALGEPAKALPAATRYHEHRPEAADGWALLGEARAAGGDLPGAREALGQAVVRAPKNPLFALRLAHVERLAGEPVAAVSRLESAGPPPSFEREWTLEHGEALLAAGRSGDAAAALAPFAQANPDDALGRTLLGAALLSGGDAKGALIHLARANALDPASVRARGLYVDALDRVAVAEIGAGDLPAAEQHLTTAAPLAEGATTFHDLGLVLVLTGRGKDAVAPLEHAVALGDGAGGEWLLGRARAAAGDHAGARQALAKALDGTRDPKQRAAIVVDLAASDLDAGDAAQAHARLEAAIAVEKDPTARASLVAADRVAVRAAATAALRAGAFDRAYRLLEPVTARLGKDDPSAEAIGVRCDFALAASGAGMKDAALGELRKLDHAKATCPYAAPADKLVIPILTAWNEGQDTAQADRVLAVLDGLKKRATGPASTLLRDAARRVAVRAATEAYAKGKIARARSYLATARSYGGPDTPEMALDGALLDLEEGNVDGAIAAFERLAGTFPEALLDLGIAWERKRDPAKALDAFKRASAAGLKWKTLDAWIAAKERIWGEAP